MKVWFERESRISADSAISVVSVVSTEAKTCCENFECQSEIATSEVYWHEVTFISKGGVKN